MSIFDNIKTIVGGIAPVIGNMLGGPLGGMAMSTLSKVLLGTDNASQEDILTALQNPENLLKLKKEDHEFEIRMREIGVSELQIASADRDSARNRQIQSKDNMPAILGSALTIGFFGIVFTLMFVNIESDVKDIINVLVGALATAWIQVVNFYFGSSAGSKVKTFLMKNEQKH
jgi:hypothetical protein